MGVFSGLRLRTLLVASLLFACEAHATPPSPARATPPSGENRFEPEAIGFVTDSALDRARDALDRGDASAAKSIADAALGDATAIDTPRLHFVAARANLALRDTAGAIAHLEAIDRTPDHPLAVYARLERATELEATSAGAALELARVLASVDFAGATRARRIEARTRLATGDREGALVVLRRLVADATGETLAELAAPLAEALIARGDAASIREALALEHRLYAHAPRTTAGRDAPRIMLDLVRRLPAGDRSGGEPSLDERLARAESLAASRSDDALEAYDELLRTMPETDDRLCSVRFGRVKVVERVRDRRTAATELLAVAEKCSDPEIRGYCLFKAGRALSQGGDDERALATYARFASEAARSRFADDAAIAAARIRQQRGELEAMRAGLLAAAAAYPDGDLRGEAYFLAAWSLRREGKLEASRALLAEARRNGASEAGEENAGRAAYWEARTIAELGRRDEAASAFEAVARSVPLSYYGMSALSRLAEIDADRAAMVRGATHGDESPLILRVERDSDRPGLARASELLAVGEVASAEAELTRLGMLGERATDASVLLVASLYVATDHPNDAVSLMRRRMVAHRAGSHDGVSRAALRLGYPRAFAPLIENAAQVASVPSAFVRAIAREESSFDPTAVSRAHAYGLIQILVPTARSYSRDVGLEPNAHNLKDPATNLAFGTRFMARLFTRFAANPGLVPAAYNAGHGAVERWLREDRNRAFDVFLEEIPYEETRRYTRRVLQSYGIYSLLDDGVVPTFGTALPPDPNVAAAGADASVPAAP